MLRIIDARTGDPVTAAPARRGLTRVETHAPRFDASGLRVLLVADLLVRALELGGTPVWALLTGEREEAELRAGATALGIRPFEDSRDLGAGLGEAQVIHVTGGEDQAPDGVRVAVAPVDQALPVPLATAAGTVLPLLPAAAGADPSVLRAAAGGSRSPLRASAADGTGPPTSASAADGSASPGPRAAADAPTSPGPRTSHDASASAVPGADAGGSSSKGPRSAADGSTSPGPQQAPVDQPRYDGADRRRSAVDGSPSPTPRSAAGRSATPAPHAVVDGSTPFGPTPAADGASPAAVPSLHAGPVSSVRAVAAVDPAVLRLALLSRRRAESVWLDVGALEEARRTLVRWRRAVAVWAARPSRPIPDEVRCRLRDAWEDDLDVPAVLRVLEWVEDRPDLPDGARFETYAYADRLLGLDLTRDLGSPA